MDPISELEFNSGLGRSSLRIDFCLKRPHGQIFAPMSSGVISPMNQIYQGQLRPSGPPTETQACQVIRSNVSLVTMDESEPSTEGRGVPSTQYSKSHARSSTETSFLVTERSFDVQYLFQLSARV